VVEQAAEETMAGAVVVLVELVELAGKVDKEEADLALEAAKRPVVDLVTPQAAVVDLVTLQAAVVDLVTPQAAVVDFVANLQVVQVAALAAVEMHAVQLDGVATQVDLVTMEVAERVAMQVAERVAMEVAQSVVAQVAKCHAKSHRIFCRPGVVFRLHEETTSTNYPFDVAGLRVSMRRQ